MYDVDGNGVIDIQEMTKIVQVGTEKCGRLVTSHQGFQRMIHLCSNAIIWAGKDFINVFWSSQAIYDMLGACSSNRPADSAEERAKNIFAKMDENNDGQLTQDEFLKGCLQDEELSKMLAP